jgi:hypothetical protein
VQERHAALDSLVVWSKREKGVTIVSCKYSRLYIDCLRLRESDMKDIKHRTMINRGLKGGQSV